jgi:hypothetical protein
MSKVRRQKIIAFTYRSLRKKNYNLCPCQSRERNSRICRNQKTYHSSIPSKDNTGEKQIANKKEKKDRAQKSN